MITGRTTDYAKLNARLKVARQLVPAKPGISGIGKHWGTSREYVYKTLKRHAPDLLREVQSGSKRGPKQPADLALTRLKTVAEFDRKGLTRTEAADHLGITVSALSMWLLRNAPFGVEDALADYLEEEEAA